MGHFISLAIVLGGIGWGCGFGSDRTDDDDDDDDDPTDGDSDDVGCEFGVTGSRPMSDSTRVDGDEAIIVSFSDPVDADSVNADTFAVTGPWGAAAGSYVVEGADVTFTPDTPMHLLGNYGVTLTTGIVDREACPLAAPFALSFQIDSGDWSGRIDLATDAAGFLEVAHNRRGDMLLPYQTAGATGSIKAVRFDAAQRIFSLPELVEDEGPSSSEARAAINEDGDAVVAWQVAPDPPSRGWARYTSGSWGAATVEPGAAGRLGVTADGTAVMVSTAAGPDTTIEILSPLASAWTSPTHAIDGASLRGVIQSGERVEIVAYDESALQLVARGYVQGEGLDDLQPLSQAGVSADALHLQYLPGEDLAATWVENGADIHFARFDAASATWTPAPSPLTEGAMGSAVCANTGGARLAAFIRGGSIYAAHADPGEAFAEPQEMGSPAGMEYARCALDELGNGVLVWAQAGEKSFHARYAGGAFTEAAELGDGPTVHEAVADPETGRAHVVFYNGEKLTARAFE